MSNKYVSDETWTVGQLIWTYKGILHTKFQGLKVWATPFLYALFVFYCLTVENPLKMPPNQRFR